jgi:hypothetical protein
VVPPTLQKIAKVLIAFQDAREEADYDLSRSLVRADVLAKVLSAHAALNDWSSVRRQPAGAAFLTAMLVMARQTR